MSTEPLKVTGPVPALCIAPIDIRPKGAALQCRLLEDS